MSEENNNREHEFANLSDNEINTLYEIITLAGEKEEGASFGPGLFAAYDEIIAQNGISGGESGKYFAFVCRMVSGRRQGETPMQRFVDVLAEAGIHVDFEQDGEAPNDSHHGHEQGDGSLEEAHQISLDPRERYNGAVSQAETLADEYDTARLPYEPGFAVKTGFQDIPRRRSAVQRRSRSEDTHAHITAADTSRGRMNSSRQRAAELERTQPRRRTRSVLSDRGLRIQRPHQRTSSPGNSDSYSADESDALSTPNSRGYAVRTSLESLAMHKIRDPRRFIPPEVFQRPEEEMEDNADAFQQTKGMVGQRRILGEWAQKASERRAKHEQLEKIAENFDKEKLLRDSLVIWREKLDAQRLDKAWEDNESFYQMIEDSAVKERERNLKWIAFTHWDQMAKDEKQRTSVARRHILRKRYFNAWNHVTAVNDLKVRRFVLRRFFNIWQARMHELEKMDLQANAVYENCVIDRSYKKWAFAFLDKVAPQWHSLRRMREYFLRWRDIVRQIRQRDHEVEQMYLRNVQRKALAALAAKNGHLRGMNATAEKMRSENLLSTTLGTWKREAVLAPRATKLIRQTNQRLLHGTITAWKTQAQFEQQATQVCDQRVLRNAFTAWNDQLRIRFLESQIEIRLKAESFYKLTLALRSSIAEREYNRKIASIALQHWLSRAQTRQRSIEGAEQTFEASQRERRLHVAFTKLTSIFNHRQQQEVQAQNFRETRLVVNALSAWQERHAHIQHLDMKARVADFYILTTRSLKAMSRVTQEHRRQRKREAYNRVRRQNKMNLAREMFRRMQLQLAHVRHMDHVAGEYKEDHAGQRTIAKLRQWKGLAFVCLQQERQAEELYKRKLLASALGRMVGMNNMLAEMNNRARGFSAGSIAVEALNCLRKMDRRLFQVKGQEAWAIALREKHGEKHIKNMLKYWLEQAKARSQELNDEEGYDSNQDESDENLGGVQRDFRHSTMTAPGDMSVFDTTTWHLEPLNLDLNAMSHPTGQHQQNVDVAFEPNDVLVTSTPLPGYLRTPSKRDTARARARERLAAFTNLNAGTTERTIRFAEPAPAPATAPPRQQSASAPSVLPSPSHPQASITPFERKLREKGYASSSRMGRTMPGTSRFGASISVGPLSSGMRSSAPRGFSATTAWQSGVDTPRQSGLVGFEDIAEDNEERTKEF